MNLLVSNGFLKSEYLECIFQLEMPSLPWQQPTPTQPLSSACLCLVSYMQLSGLSRCALNGLQILRLTRQWSESSPVAVRLT